MRKSFRYFYCNKTCNCRYDFEAVGNICQRKIIDFSIQLLREKRRTVRIIYRAYQMSSITCHKLSTDQHMPNETIYGLLKNSKEIMFWWKWIRVCPLCDQIDDRDVVIASGQKRSVSLQVPTLLIYCHLFRSMEVNKYSNHEKRMFPKEIRAQKSMFFFPPSSQSKPINIVNIYFFRAPEVMIA